MKRVVLLPALAAIAVVVTSPRSAAQAPPARGGDAAALGMVVYNPANRHHYQLVRVTDGISWEGAAAAAAGRTLGGVRGHLVCISDEAEQTFVNANLHAENAWMGAYRDRNAPDSRQKTAGWRWVSREPFAFTYWNDTEPNNRDNEPAAIFWVAHRWMDAPPDHKVSGYAIEFPTVGPQGEASKLGGEQVEALLARVQQKYRGMRSYQATVQFSSKALLAAGQGVNVQLILQPPHRFRIEGRGNNGSLLAVSDGRAFVMARTYPREPMHFMIKRAQGLQSLQEAMSLIIEAPLPPSLTGFVLGTVPPSLWGGGVRLAGCLEETPQEELFRSRLRMQYIGDNPKDAEATLLVSTREGRILSSEINYRDQDLIPTTVREVHNNVRLNEAIPATAFAFQATPNAVQVDDLGERPDEVSYSPTRR
jgi:outer membrane lipoprotein-sorting protein